MKYKYYPRIDEPDFYEKLWEKKEFYQNRYTTENLDIISKPNEFRLKPQQLFLRNYISPDTPYNSILIFHGTGYGKTCTAVQIAEGFKKFMRSIHTDERRKIIVILSSRIKDNFKDTIYNINKEGLKRKPDDIVQCTGNEYSLETSQFKAMDINQKRREVTKRINSNYIFYGYEEFSNDVLNLLKSWDGKPENLEDFHIRGIKKQFKNRLIIIDEIHNIKSDSTSTELRKVPPILEAIIKYGENIKLVLLSATPMYDNAGEFIYILNLLLLNDNREPINRGDFLDKEDNLLPGADKELERISKGYISFLRGANPKMFPSKIYPKQLSYIPKIKYDMKGILIPENERIKHLNLTFDEMSKYQYEQYKKQLYSKKKNNINNNDIEEDVSLEDASYSELQPLFYLSNIVLPNKDNNNVLAKIGDAYQRYDNGIGPFIIKEKTDPKTSRKYFEFEFQKHVRFNLGTKLEKPFIDQDYLQKYSTKYFRTLNSIRYGKGICYIYSEFKFGGVLPFALMLEQNGFKRHTVLDERQLLDYPKNKMGGGGKRDFICALCGEIRTNPKHNENHTLYHPYKIATYVIMTGDKYLTRIEPKQLTELVNSDKNINGEEVKVILGTRTTGEGLDFLRIRQIHVMEPWYNMARMDQIIGRGVRMKSHNLLPKEERNVEIYHHTIVPPVTASVKEKETETIDSRFYRKAEVKDIKIKSVENVLKKSAVDCAFNKIANTPYSTEKVKQISSTGNKVEVSLGSQPYSRDCDYKKDCEIKCVWEPVKGKRYKINTDTYTEKSARNDIENAKRLIKNLFSRDFIFKLYDLVIAVKKEYPELEDKFIYVAIQEMIDNINEPVYDRFNRKGKIIYKGEYYIYQPLEINNEKLPMYYRQIPIKEKIKKVPLENTMIEVLNSKQDELSKKATIKELILELQENIEKIKEKLVVNHNDIDLICLGIEFDYLNNNDKKKLLRNAIIRYKENGGDDFTKLLLKYCSPILIKKYRDIEMMPRKDDVIEGFRMDKEYFLFDKKTNMVIPASRELKEKIRINLQLQEKKKKDNEKFNRVYGYMQKWKLGNYLFKIYDGTQQKNAITVELKPSKRSEIKGKVCRTYYINDLLNIMKVLKINYNSKSKDDICININFQLRANDIDRVGGKRWFINSLYNY